MKKILFCQLRNHGDVIRTFPTIDAIKCLMPDAHVGFSCLPEMEETASICKSIDELIIQPRLLPVTDHVDNTRICDISILSDAVSYTRNRKYDIYVDFHGNFQSGLFGSVCNIPVRLGRYNTFVKDGSFLFNTDFSFFSSSKINRMERHFLQCQSYFKNLEIVPPQRTNHRSKNIVFFPGSSKKGILKRWSIESYVKLANLLKDSLNVVPVFCLGNEEGELQSVINNLSDFTVVSVNKWEEYLSIFQDVRCVIGNDIACIHLAIWKGIPTYVICGPTSGIINGVWHYCEGYTFQGSYQCCQDVWHGNCSLNHQCMNSITPEQVFHKILDDLR